MESATQPKIRFHGIRIVDVNLATQQPPQEGENIQINLDARLFPLEEGSDHFQIWMSVDLEAADFWSIRVGGVGSFEFSEGLSPEERRALINVNAPAIMFPYFRAFISTLSANCGGSLPVLIIPPHFFVGELEEVQLATEPPLIEGA